MVKERKKIRFGVLNPRGLTQRRTTSLVYPSVDRTVGMKEGFMFTGIITHIGKLHKRTGSVFVFHAPFSVCKKLKQGTSISINGTCLTVLSKPVDNSFSVEIMLETRKKTTFGQLKINDLVNLELPVTPTDLLSGHILTGHIDDVGKIEKIEKEGISKIMTISIPSNLGKYIVSKGSIAVNGISLTVIEDGSGYFTVGIIPYTWQKTMLCKIKINDKVNLEVDIIAKYLEKLGKGKIYE